MKMVVLQGDGTVNLQMWKIHLKAIHSEPEMRLGELEMNLGNDQYSNVIPQWVNQMALKIEIFT